jgi:putative SOS response-associated peptidase YedK
MCGRFTQEFSYQELHAYFSFFGHPLGNLEPPYNICPTDPVIAWVHTEAGAALERMRWGLVPGWWKKSLKEVPATFNARAETVAAKPMFRSAFKARRCIIPASGYYEWQDTPGGKQPWYFTSASGPVLLIAGLWEIWKNPEPPGDTVRSATMVITEPNAFVARYHDQMPVVLGKDQIGPWLSGEAGAELLMPAANDALKAWSVSRKVSTSKAPNEPSLIVEVAL